MAAQPQTVPDAIAQAKKVVQPTARIDDATLVQLLNEAVQLVAESKARKKEAERQKEAADLLNALHDIKTKGDEAAKTAAAEAEATLLKYYQATGKSP